MLLDISFIRIKGNYRSIHHGSGYFLVKFNIIKKIKTAIKKITYNT